MYGYQYTGLLNEPGHRMELGGPDTEALYTAYASYVQRVRGEPAKEPAGEQAVKAQDPRSAVKASQGGTSWE